MSKTRYPITKICMDCGKNFTGYRPVNKTQIEAADGTVIGKTYPVQGLPVGYAHVTCLEKVKSA